MMEMKHNYTVQIKAMQYTPGKRFLLWSVLFVYVLWLVYVMLHHEPWGDELHTWNIAKASDSLSNVIYNTRYEGHPPLWVILLWMVSKCTHDFFYVQMLHALIASCTVYVVLFHSPFPLLIKLLLPFGYYFLFEYAVISRNYALGVFIALLACIVLTRDFKLKTVVYYVLLFLMSNVHLLSLLLAACIHLYFLFTSFQSGKSRRFIFINMILATLLFLPALYCILPPHNSELSAAASLSRWSMQQLSTDVQTPFRAFVPLPTWWKYNFWNEQFLLSLHDRVSILKWIYPLLSIGFVLLACYVLKGDKKSLLLFIVNVVLSFIIGNILMMATQRYSGYVFIGFIVAYWLYCSQQPMPLYKTKIIGVLLLMQMIAGVFTTFKDVQLPFSNMYRVKEVISKAPRGSTIVTDYWTLIAFAAYTDKPAYCIDLQKTQFFDLWQMNMTEMRLYPYRYCRGLSNLFRNKNIDTIYFMGTDNPALLSKTDSRLFSLYNVQLMYHTQGAIEKKSDLYLYRISKF